MRLIGPIDAITLRRNFISFKSKELMQNRHYISYVKALRIFRFLRSCIHQEFRIFDSSFRSK